MADNQKKPDNDDAQVEQSQELLKMVTETNLAVTNFVTGGLSSMASGAANFLAPMSSDTSSDPLSSLGQDSGFGSSLAGFDQMSQSNNQGQSDDKKQMLEQGAKMLVMA